MDDLISRQAAIDNLAKSYFAGVLDDLIHAEDAVNAVPTADAVQVVRCQECKWWKTNYMWNGQECKVCAVEPYEPVRKPDDYCSRGERKDDDN